MGEKRKRRAKKTARQIVYEKFVAAGARGLTDQELDDGTPKWLSSNSSRPRRIDMVADRTLKATKLRRPTRSGKMAIVWAVKR